MKTPTFCYCHLYREYAELFSRHKDGSRHYQKGNLVNTLLNQQTIYHYVLRGTVSLSMITENGYRKMLLICGPGMIFPIFRDGADYRTNYTIQFQAMETVETHFLYESHLKGLLLENPSFLLRTLNVALDVLDLYTYDAANTVYHDPRMAVCNLLLLLWRQLPRPKGSNRLTISRDDIAAATGHSRPQGSKQIGFLSQLGIVKTGRGYLQILDVPRLQEFCSSDVLDESLSP